MITGSLFGASANIQSALKSFFLRGGLANGLLPLIAGRVWYVDGQNGSNGNSGRAPDQAFLTMAKAFSKVGNGDFIIFQGVIKEQLTAPQDVFDVTIIGGANRPRQATDGGVATGGGASWLSPAAPTALTPLLKLREQGWTLCNFQMAPVASSACVRLSRAEVAADQDASHASFINMYMVGGGASGIGIEDVGGASRVLIDTCRFELLTGTAIKGISTGIAVPAGWIVKDNLFLRNTNSIAMSSSQGLFQHNVINQAANDANNKMNLVAVAAQGDLNRVLDNQFSDAAANVTIAKGYKPGTTDVWRNWVTDSASMVVTVPA